MKRLATVAFVVALVGTMAGSAQASSAEQLRGSWCEQRFADTMRERDAAWDNRDLPRLMSFYRTDAVEVDPGGGFYPDKTAITAYLDGLFQQEFTSSFVEFKRVVDCNAALRMVESHIEIPAAGVKMHFVSTVTFSLQRGHWRVLSVSSTMLPN